MSTEVAGNAARNIAPNFWEHYQDVEVRPLSEGEKLVMGSIQDTILDEARTVIYGDREKTYGDPGKNLRVIAGYWNTYLTSKGFDFGEGLDYDDVCNMMVLLKVARLANTPLHRDSLVDVCGYLALAERVDRADKQAKTGAGSPAP